jgi:protein associated with RNAse G/E
LCVDCQIVGIQQYNGFEFYTIIEMDIALGEEFQFFTNEFDAFSMRTVHIHDIGLDLLFIVFIDTIYEMIDDCSFSTSRRTIKYYMRNTVILVKLIDTLINIIM